MPLPNISVTENLWIPLADGTRLAARLWLPAHEGVGGSPPVPAILEYIPYRKRDGTRGRDEPMHGFFAEQGYAAVRVDMRGSGESDGVLDDEYLRQEQDDAVEVIAWIARQPWCSGAVGMMGKSWGGFNALQVAARRPPALKAIITVCSTDDRYATDIHYSGGCLLNDNLWWGAIMLAYQGRPPDPELRDDWREQWLERLDHMPFWPALWLAHPTRDAYWKHGSICEDWDAVACPVLAVGGWSDSYTDAVPRLLAGLRVPRLGIIGPWAHIYPQDGSPGPAIDFLGEAVRWWDFLSGVMASPLYRTLGFDLTEIATVTKLYGIWVGIAGGEWMGTGVAGERPADQRFDDGLSLCFDGAPLNEPIEVLGNPVVELDLAADQAQAQIGVRLCDVSPEGSSLRLSYAVLNLGARDSAEHPRPLSPGQTVRVRVTLKICGHRVPAGHRLRLAISTGYWPLVWPARKAATVTIDTASSRLLLPLRTAPADEAAVVFGPPRHGPRAPATRLAESRVARCVGFDLLANTATVVTQGLGGLFGEGVVRWEAIGTDVAHDLTRTMTVGTDPLSAETRIVQRYVMGREGWRIRIETETAMTGDAEHFTVTGELRAYENGALVRERRWSQRVPRQEL